MIVVLDASSIVSAALKVGSIPEQALLRAVGGVNRIILSQDVETEYRDVLSRPKFDRFVSLERRQQILGVIVAVAQQIDPLDLVCECTDPRDDKYLSLAAAGRADVIVTGDEKHLLPMGPWRGIAILRAAEFIELDARQSV